MAFIDTTPPTISAIYASYEARPFKHRPRLGASEIGAPCDRAIWYRFRHALQPKLPGRILRLFETGKREEMRLIQNLRDVGIEVHDTVRGNQIHYVDPDCVWFSGSLDAMARGFEEEPKTWHVVEIKTSNLRQFEQLEELGVKMHKPEHYAQMQMYMHWSGATHAYYFCVCKDDDRIYGERVKYDQHTALKLAERAHRIINAEKPPESGFDPASPPCRWCNYAKLCSGEQIADINCRTCTYYECDCQGERCTLGFDTGSTCDRHLYIQELVPCEIYSEDDDTVTYLIGDEKFTTGLFAKTSEELKARLEGRA